MRRREIICPNCQTADNYTYTAELRGRFSWSVFLIGGIEAVMFRNAGRSKRVRCNQCETLFYLSRPLGRVARGLFWLSVLPGIAVLLLFTVKMGLMFFAH